MSPLELGLLLGWGTLVGLDLVSVGQVMISRPLVAATVAGLILGEPVAGVTVGMVLELFALEVLPVGAVRYPDYGPASVAAAVVATADDPLRHLGLAAATGLLVAYAGEYTILALRRRNSLAIARHLDDLASGDRSRIAAFHLAGFARDTVRAFLLTVGGLAVAMLARAWPPLSNPGASLLDAVVIGAALSAAVAGTVRLAGSIGFRWFVVGLVVGIAVVVIR